MDNARPPRSVFSLEEINLLVPAVRNAFQEAVSGEWIVFALFQSVEGGSATTSGAMFVEGGRLHVVIANHRIGLAPNSEDLARVRANPLYSVQGSGGALAFDSPRFVMGTKANWLGGHRASASELILDHGAFLSYLQLAGVTATPVRAAGSLVPNPARERGSPAVGGPASQRDWHPGVALAASRTDPGRCAGLDVTSSPAGMG